MIEAAFRKMPKAHLYQGDFSLGLAEPLKGRYYDFIIATYALHHLTEEQQVLFLRELRERLNTDGKTLIGDVAFETRILMEQCRLSAGEEWDDEENYFVAEDCQKSFRRSALKGFPSAPDFFL